MSIINNHKLQLLYVASNKFKQLGDYLMGACQKIDADSIPEFNAVAIPNVSGGNFYDVDALGFSLNNLMFDNLKIQLTDKPYFSLFNNSKLMEEGFPLVVGNFNVPEDYTTLAFKEGAYYKYALQKVIHKIDGNYFDVAKNNTCLELEQIVFEPLHGEVMRNPLLVCTRNNLFIYRNPKNVVDELNNGTCQNTRLGPHWDENIKRLYENKGDIFKYNTVKALELNSNFEKL